MELVLKKTSELIPYAKNSRTHSEKQVDQIAKSIEEFGFNNPILLTDDNQIIAGHGRVIAAKKLKIKEVPCIYLSHLNEAQRKAYTIADNQLALNAGWDLDILGEELKSLLDISFDIDVLGFDIDQLSDILMDHNTKDKDEKKSKDEKFILELTFPNKEEMIDRYNEFMSAGLIVRAKNG